MTSFGFIIYFCMVLVGLCLGQDSTCPELQQLTTDMAEVKQILIDLVSTVGSTTSTKEEKKARRKERKAAKKAAKTASDIGLYENCAKVQEAGNTEDDVYTISLRDGTAVQVYCDLHTDGGGWTVFQKRYEGSVDFFLGWDDYVQGFGPADGEYWLGLENMWSLVEQGPQEMRVDMEDFDGHIGYAQYSAFSIGPADDNYRLFVDGYTGDAGHDQLETHSGAPFSTKDNDNDGYDEGSCAEVFLGAWWYTRCLESNLNGHYYESGHEQASSGKGVNWQGFKGHGHLSLKRSEMKMRPAGRIVSG